jgi:hypothetical protein
MVKKKKKKKKSSVNDWSSILVEVIVEAEVMRCGVFRYRPWRQKQ